MMNENQHQQQTGGSDNKSEDYVDVTYDKLSLEELATKVLSPAAGAIATFSGTTRDDFNGKKVIRLEYEAYTPMAKKEMFAICNRMRGKWELIKIAMVHRIGEVPVGEASVIVAASSTHRKDALEASQYGIDEIKTRVPIWKKEVYEDGSMWKENCEGLHHKQQTNNNNTNTSNTNNTNNNNEHQHPHIHK